jgi:hypothetical protein
MASTKLDIGNIVRATVRDVTTRFPRDGRLTLQFLFTALIFGVIAWLLFYLATECRTLLEGTRLIVPLAQWATLALLSALFTPLSLPSIAR